MKPRMSDEDLARVQETRNRLTKVDGYFSDLVELLLP